jgi:hypothetical protein
MIEINLAKAMATLKLIERMLYSNETWTVTIGDQTKPAFFEFLDNAVVVRANGFNFDVPTIGPAVIKSNGEVVFVHAEKVFSGSVCWSWMVEMALPLTA